MVNNIAIILKSNPLITDYMKYRYESALYAGDVHLNRKDEKV